MEDEKTRMWQVIADIYTAIMALKEVHENRPEFSGTLDLYFSKELDYVTIEGTAIKPFKFKIDNGHWIDVTEREINFDDRGKK